MKKLFYFLVALWVMLLPIANAFAATTANSIITAQTPKEAFLQFTNSSSAGTYATLYTGSANGTKITSIFITNSDNSATHVVTCGLFNSATQYWSTSVTTTSPASGSFNSLDLLGAWTGLPKDSDGNPYIYLNSASDTLQCTFATAITSAKFINIGAIGADF